LEQQKLCHTIKIKCIPKTLNENCSDIIQTIAKKVDCNIIVNSAYRLTTKENNSGILIAEISSLEMKNDLLRKIKKIKLNANIIANTWSSDIKYMRTRDSLNSKEFYLRKLGLYAEKNHTNMFGLTMLKY